MNDVRWPHTGAILAGGQSRRMGRPKEGVPLADGRPMIRHVLVALEQICRRTVIVGDCVGFDCQAEQGVTQLRDLRPGGGPMVGVETLLRSGLDVGYLVVACDQPLLSPGVLRRLVSASAARPSFLRPDDGAWLGPFPGYFPAVCLEQLDAAMRQGVTSLRRVFADANITWTPIAPDELAHVKSFNRPHDLAELLPDSVSHESAGHAPFSPAACGRSLPARVPGLNAAE